MPLSHALHLGCRHSVAVEEAELVEEAGLAAGSVVDTGVVREGGVQHVGDQEPVAAVEVVDYQYSQA